MGTLNDIKLIIFDLDGTLFRPNDIVVEAVYGAIDRTADKFGLDIDYPDEEKIYELLGQPDYQFVHDLGLDLTPEHMKYLKSQLNQIESEMVAEGSGAVYEGALDALEFLKDSGYRLAIAGSWGREYVLSIMDYFDLHHFINFSVCIDDVGHGGKREILEDILVNQEVFPSEALFVADRASDFLAAREIDVRSIGCTWGFGKPEELDVADYKVNSFYDLIVFFKRLGSNEGHTQP